jgi:hypothetical protein
MSNKQAWVAAAALDQATIDSLKQKHGRRLYLVEDADVGPVVFKPASKEVWAEFIDQSGNVDDATRTLIDACVVYPAGAELQQMHDDFPAFADSLAVAIREKSGGRRGLTPKAL